VHHTRFPKVFLLLLASALFISACGVKAAPEPVTNEQASAGRAVFVEKSGCNRCHPGGERGLGPRLHGAEFEAKHPTDETIRRQIRTGGGGMPAFTPDRLTEQQVEDVIAYIRWLGDRPTKAAP
jgi:mono/diheme cytochrome c family protein